MKTLRKILFIAVLIFALLFAVAYAFLFFQGKTIITKQLEGAFHIKVNLDYAGLTFPLNLEIRNLDIPGLVKVDYVFVSPSIIGLLTGNIILNDLRLIRPEFIYERIPASATATPASADTAVTVPAPVSTPTPAPGPKAPPKNKQNTRLVFKHLNIKNGKLDFTDRTLEGEAAKITIKDIDFDLTNLYLYPRSAVTNFRLNGKIPWQQGQEEGKIEARGWLNLFKKDMQATLKIADIDGISLYPYYAKWVDLEKARIDTAKLNLVSNIKSVNNNLSAECCLELTDIAFKPRPQEEEANKAEKIAAAVLDIFKALNKGKIVFNFTIKTKMVNPQFGFNDFKEEFKARLAEGIKSKRITAQDIVRFPGRLAEGTVKSAADLSRAFIDGIFTVGNEVKKAFEVALKKEQED
jgi:hypothetical protein